MDEHLPKAKAERVAGTREAIKAVVARRGLTGLANDTKWNELVAAMRARPDWRPSYRFKCVAGPPSDWDVEWLYHLPFPLIGVEWLDISCVRQGRSAGTLVDESPWIEAAVRRAGLDHRKVGTLIRIFGYAPRDETLLEPPGAEPA
jgi:hypothetical protein